MASDIRGPPLTAPLEKLITVVILTTFHIDVEYYSSMLSIHIPEMRSSAFSTPTDQFQKASEPECHVWNLLCFVSVSCVSILQHHS